MLESMQGNGRSPVLFRFSKKKLFHTLGNLFSNTEKSSVLHVLGQVLNVDEHGVLLHVKIIAGHQVLD